MQRALPIIVIASVALFFAACDASPSTPVNTPTPALSARDQVARAFVDALLKGDDQSALKYLLKQSPDDYTIQRVLPGFRGITENWEFTNITISSILEATPSPAEKANGFGERYHNSAAFAYRCKRPNREWQDASISFSLGLFLSGLSQTRLSFDQQ